jgi:heme-degrading monooxygenase HmoA
MIANTPNPPYYLVVFTSIHTGEDLGYQEMADKMVDLAKNQEGFLGIESTRNNIGITVSYWQDEDSILKWRNNIEHISARNKGKEIWYSEFKVRIAKVERDYDFSRDHK